MTYTDKAQAVFDGTKNALQTVYNALNKGQRQKILKNEEVKALFDKYGVETEES